MADANTVDRESQAATTVIGKVLQDYAARGVLRGLAQLKSGSTRARFRILWFQERSMDLAVDTSAGRLGMTGVLPGIDSRSAMYRDLRAWLRERQGGELPAHRGLDPSRATLRGYNRQGILSLYLHSHDRDWDYATRRMIHLVNELYLDFLSDGRHYEWVVETFELDPVNPRWP